jgi:hypothetical protein
MTFIKTLLVLFAVSAVYWSGCSGKNNPANSSGGDIVCKDGEAWIIDGTTGGSIFAPNGDMIAVGAIGEKPDERWYGAKVGTYSTSGGKLTTVTSEGTKTVTYKVSGNKLTLTGGGDPVTYTKNPNVHLENVDL